MNLKTSPTLHKFRTRIFSKGGRGSGGNITVYHRGGLSHKKSYRYINNSSTIASEAIVLELFHDPNRTSKIAFVYYFTGFCAYILATDGLKKGSTIFCGNQTEKLEDAFVVGSWLPLKLMPIGFIINNIELKPFAGGKICRAGGSYAVILKKSSLKVLLRLKSGWNMWVNNECFASLGSLSSYNYFRKPLRKAGLVRHFGFRPTVRGIAKNPVDHPHGGRTNKGQHPTTPWGRLTKGKPTVSRKSRANSLKRRFR